MSVSRPAPRRVLGEGGYTMVELLVVLTIFLIVVTSLTTLFLSGARAELDANRRLEAQQTARVAVDYMRREIHCASALTLTSASSITITLPAGCATAGGSQTTVVYATQSVGAQRFKLNRTKQGQSAVPLADYITSGTVFSYVPPSIASLGRLRVQLPVDIHPNEASGAWLLDADIVLRNTTRSSE